MPFSLGFGWGSSKGKSAPADDLEADAQPIHPSDEPTSSGWFWSATIAVGLMVLVVAVAGVKSWSDLKISQARADQLRREMKQVDSSVERLKQRIHLLQSDSELLERVAREELGVVHPNEVVVILPE